MRTLYRNKIKVYRLTAEAGSKEAYKYNGDIYGSILSLSPDDIILSEGNPATSGVLLTPAESDLIVSDKICYNEIDYIVKAIKTPDRLFSIEFKRAIIEKMNS